jgi:iron complex outermembrane receptor protein
MAITAQSLRMAAWGVAASALIVGAGLLTPSLAHADDAAPAAATAAAVAGQAASSAPTVGELVITAQRREENLQNVPISATVVTGSQLRSKGVVGVQDLQDITPGLSIQPPVSSETFINIRGVGIQQTNPASSNGVAFYVDGVYVPSLIDTVDSFYDLSDVEVLRGPQGTLVGSNADGGAIFVNSAQPRINGGVGGYIQQTIGNYANYRTEGGVNIPLTDWAAARIGFVYESRNSFTTNLGPQPPPAGVVPSNQNQPGNVDYWAVRAQLLVKPSDNSDVTFRFEPYESRTDGFALKPDMSSIPSTSSAFDPFAASIQNQPYTIDYSFPQFYNIQGQRTSIVANWVPVSWLKVRSVSSYQTGYESDADDIDTSSAPGNFTFHRKASFNTYTQEINLLSNSPGPFQWVVGGYYLNARQPLVLSFVDPPPLHSVALNIVADHVNVAGFASGTYNFNSQWSLQLGGRYSHDSQPFHELICTGFPQPCGNFNTADDEFSWTAKLSFQVTPDTLLYASGSSGYKAGGVNLQIPDIRFTPPPFQPENNIVEELGVKTTLLEQRLRINADIYDSQYSHYQLQEFLGGLPNTQGPGSANIWGGELEISGRFDQLYFNTGVSYMNGAVSSNFLYQQNFGPPVTILSGTEIPYAPPWTFNIDAGYDFPFWNGKLTPDLRYQYQDAQFIIITHAALPGPDQVIPSHGTLDFRLKYASPQRWSVEGYVTNLTGSTYFADVLPSPQPTANNLVYGAPRQFGMRLAYEW